jgi:hypothetical protein
MSESARRHPDRIALLVALAWLGAACAEHAGGRATQGAIEALRAPPPEGTATLASRVGRETTNGALAELSSPEGLASITSLVDATVTRSLEAALREPPGVQGRVGGRPGRSLVERMSRDSAAAFGAAFAEELRSALGPDGRGPLATSLGATAAQVSGSAVQGVRGELDGLFPGCEGPDRPACLQAGVRSLGREAAAGFVEGVVQSASWVLAALAFVMGVAAVLAAQATARLVRRRPPERREAHP